MPTFLKGRKRNPWKGQVQREGFKFEAAYFPTKEDAVEWEESRRRVLLRKSKGLSIDIADLQKITVGDMSNKYLKEETKYKASWRIETYRINRFLEYKDFKQRPLIAFTRPDAIEYRNYLEREFEWSGRTYQLNGKIITPNRTAKPLKPGTVNRISAIFRDMWNIASKDWRGYESLKEIGNPWSGVSATKRARKRTRRLNDLPTRQNELDRLLVACDRSIGANKIYLRLAIHLAVQLGLRQQEILLLRWNDIAWMNSRLIIRKSKTDYKSDEEGRTIVLTTAAKLYLVDAVEFIGEHNVRGNQRIFPMTNNAFQQAWVHVVSRAGIKSKQEDKKDEITESKQGLEFRDLRREAGSRFDEAGLTKAEHDLMMGHTSQEIRGIYIDPVLSRIENKLNDYWKTAIQYHDKDLKSGEFVKRIAESPSDKLNKERWRRSDERAKQLADKMKNDPIYRGEVEEKLERFHKEQEEKKAEKERQRMPIHEATNVVKFKKGSK